MRLSFFISFILLLSVISSCTREFDCSDLQLGPAFIGFAPADIDSFVIRKYKQNDNFQQLIDTVLVSSTNNGSYFSSNDTTGVYVNDGKNGLKAGFDWIIYLPAINRTITVTDIVSEKKTGSCGSGIFSMDKSGCACINDVFSAKRDGQLIQFSNFTRFGNYIPIR